MKKITPLLGLLCLLFLTTTTAVAQTTTQVITHIGDPVTTIDDLGGEGKYYILRRTAEGNVDKANKSINETTVGSDLLMKKIEEEDPAIGIKSVVRIEGNATDGYSFQFVASGNYMPQVYDGGSHKYIAGTTATKFRIVQDANNVPGEWNIMDINPDSKACFNGTTAIFTGWHPGGPESRYQIVPVEIKEVANGETFSITVSYVSTVEGYTMPQSKQLEYKLGEKYGLHDTDIQPDFFSCDYPKNYYANNGNTLEVKLTPAFPFTPATLVDGELPATAPWTTLGHNDGGWLAAEADGIYVHGDKAARAPKAGALWALVHVVGTQNEFNVYSLTRGVAAPLSYADGAVGLSADGADRWCVVKNADGFALQSATAPEVLLGHFDSDRLTAAEGDLAPATLFTARDAADLVKDANINPVDNSDKQHYVGAYYNVPANQAEVYNAYQAEKTLANLRALLDNRAQMGHTVLTPGKPYRLQLNSISQDKWACMSTTADGQRAVGLPIDNSNPGLIWTFEEAADGKLLLKNLNSNSYLTDVKQGKNDATAMVGTDKATKITVIPVSGKDFVWKMVANGATSPNHNNVVFMSGDTGNVCSWNGTGGEWNIIEATTLDVDFAEAAEGLYSSLCLPFSVSLPAEVKAYKAAEIDGVENALHMTSVSDVPAGNGVVLRSTVARATLDIVESTEADMTGNLLSGTSLARSGITPSDYLILGIVNNQIGFYTPNADKLKANRAYYQPAAGTAAALRLVFDGEATGIDSVHAGQATDSDAVYDLSGRRVTLPLKGVYVKNGKKYIK